MKRTGEVRGKETGNVFVDNALKASTILPGLLSRLGRGGKENC
jgi:hypothetical protein